jgi:hypothetical protein
MKAGTSSCTGRRTQQPGDAAGADDLGGCLITDRMDGQKIGYMYRQEASQPEESKGTARRTASCDTAD